MPCGPYDEPPKHGFVIPIAVPGAKQVPAVIVTGASSRLPLSADYRSFYDLLGVTIGGALAAVRGREDERRRAEALAEIDRAKTLFFSNVSHEFRTPLTLMLGPLQDALASGSLPDGERERLDIAHRNSLRLLKLVNSLLDFARIEAGRTQASYEPLDLTALTADLASNFRSACERAGLRLDVDCESLPEAVHVDRDMWEKIVFNLISNAFKFTFDGSIAVRLRSVEGHAELSVSDTGIGIPEHELPRLFERFHRIEGQRSRTYEGSGIGLALVQELVKLQGGTIAVDSRLGEGTTFTVAVPFGTAHLPRERIGAARELASTTIQAEAYVEEMLRWMPDGESARNQEPVDDAAEHRRREDALRESEERFRHMADHSPVMVWVTEPDSTCTFLSQSWYDFTGHTPETGLGFGWLDATHPGDREAASNIFLAANAKREAFRLEYRLRRSDGQYRWAIDAAAPRFSPNGRFLGYIGSVIDITERKEAEEGLRRNHETFYNLVQQSPLGVYIVDAQFRIAQVSEGAMPAFQNVRPLIGHDFADALRIIWPEPFASEAIERFRQTLATGEPYNAPSLTNERRDLGTVESYEWQIRRITLPDGQFGVVCYYYDSTKLRLAEASLRESEERFRMLADNMNQLAWTCDKLGEITWYNQRWLAYTGLSFEEMKGWGWKKVQHPDHINRVVASVTRSRESGEPWEDTFPLRGKDGNYRWFLSRAVPIRSEDGKIIRWFGTNTDITEQRRSEETQRKLTSELSHRVKNMLATVQAIATQTLRHNTDPRQFVASFSGRIQSMSRVHAMLSNTDWQGADLREVIRDQLFSGAVDETRVTVRGPAVRLAPQMVPQAAMMLHELGTNSIKYGALSKPEGLVTIRWAIHEEMLRLQWVERGGPQMEAPLKRGFGTALIEQSAKGAGGDASRSIEASGVRWEISLPLLGLNEPSVSATRTSKGIFTESMARDGKTGDGASAHLAGKRFLVIEDEPLVALDIVASLEQEGIEVVGSVGSASEALDLIERTALDAALLDANLHGRPVGDIAAALTRNNVPFAFVSGYGRSGLPPAFAKATLLTKPYSQQQFLETVTKLVQSPAEVHKLRR